MPWRDLSNLDKLSTWARTAAGDSSSSQEKLAASIIPLGFFPQLIMQMDYWLLIKTFSDVIKNWENKSFWLIFNWEIVQAVKVHEQ